MFTRLAQMADETQQYTAASDDSLALGAGLLAALAVLLLIDLAVFLVSIIHLIRHKDVPNRTLWIILVILFPIVRWIYILWPMRNYQKHTAGFGSENPLNTVGQPQVAPLPAPIVQPAAPIATEPPVQAPIQQQETPTPVTPPTTVTATEPTGIQQPVQPIAPQVVAPQQPTVYTPDVAPPQQSTNQENRG